MKIRMTTSIAGTVLGNPNGVMYGDILDVTDDIGTRFCKLGYAVPLVDRKEEHAVPPSVEERAEPEPEPEPEPAPEPEPLSAPRRGRPPKNIG